MSTSTNLEIGEHLKFAVYGANDGIITTFAVVSGVAGAQLGSSIILIMGLANMAADGLSMGLSSFLGEESERRYLLRHHQTQPLAEPRLWHSGLITFFAFNLAGFLPLSPFLLTTLGLPINIPYLWSVIFTALALFAVGSLRTLVTKDRWWTNGLETLLVGTLAAAAAYLTGGLVHRLINP